jgi:hypothetical protein
MTSMGKWIFAGQVNEKENLPGGTRTLDHLLRRQMLYPAELLGGTIRIYHDERQWSSRP